jgi:dolichol-phosphate mannosyltransferase
MAGDSKKLVSIVVPCYGEEGNVSAVWQETNRMMEQVPVNWEMIFVDDGSPDGTWAAIIAAHRKDPRVRGVRLSRNFGHQPALLAGLNAASGDAVITMDGDMQHPPQLLPLLIREWLVGRKVVLTRRLDPPELPWSKRFTSRLYYRLFSYLSGVKLSPGMADFRLLDREALNVLLSLREGRPFLRGLVHWIGFDPAVLEFSAGARHHGVSRYNWQKMLSFAWSGILGFSIIPLRISLVIGIVVSAIAFLFLAETLYTRLFTDRAAPGWASLSAMISLFFGILFIILGILGEYLARILEEVRERPRFVVSETVGGRAADAASRSQGTASG